MITTATGQEAETLVAEHLADAGWQIIDRNWRRRRAEIDIVAQKAKIIYFIEVKFRRSDSQGGGVDYITPTKLRQIKFAAECWVSENGWQGDWRLIAAAVELQNGRMVLIDLLDVS